MLTCDDASQHKGTNTLLYPYNNACNKQILATVGETSTKFKIVDWIGSEMINYKPFSSILGVLILLS